MRSGLLPQRVPDAGAPLRDRPETLGATAIEGSTVELQQATLAIERLRRALLLLPGVSESRICAASVRGSFLIVCSIDSERR